MLFEQIKIMNKAFSLIIFCLLLLSCKKEEFEVENLNNNVITLLGHGGMGIGSNYPMNSYESILKCLNLGMEGAEIDIQMTKDSVLVLYHDQEIQVNSSLKGTVNSFAWDELKNLSYNNTPYLSCYSIITLEQLFFSIKNIQDYKFTFDCKLYTNNNTNQFQEAYINALIKIIEKYQLEKNVYIESQNEDFLKVLKSKKPDYNLFIYPSTFDTGIEIAKSLQLYGITISSRSITREQIQLAHKQGLRIAIWNIHSKKDHKEAINKSPDFIQTDNVRTLLDLMK